MTLEASMTCPSKDEELTLLTLQEAALKAESFEEFLLLIKEAYQSERG